MINIIINGLRFIETVFNGLVWWTHLEQWSGGPPQLLLWRNDSSDFAFKPFSGLSKMRKREAKKAGRLWRKHQMVRVAKKETQPDNDSGPSLDRRIVSQGLLAKMPTDRFFCAGAELQVIIPSVTKVVPKGGFQEWFLSRPLIQKLVLREKAPVDLERSAASDNALLLQLEQFWQALILRLENVKESDLIDFKYRNNIKDGKISANQRFAFHYEVITRETNKNDPLDLGREVVRDPRIVLFEYDLVEAFMSSCTNNPELLTVLRGFPTLETLVQVNTLDWLRKTLSCKTFYGYVASPVSEISLARVTDSMKEIAKAQREAQVAKPSLANIRVIENKRFGADLRIGDSQKARSLVLSPSISEKSPQVTVAAQLRLNGELAQQFYRKYASNATYREAFLVLQYKKVFDQIIPKQGSFLAKFKGMVDRYPNLSDAEATFKASTETSDKVVKTVFDLASQIGNVIDNRVYTPVALEVLTYMVVWRLIPQLESSNSSGFLDLIVERALETRAKLTNASLAVLQQQARMDATVKSFIETSGAGLFDKYEIYLTSGGKTLGDSEVNHDISEVGRELENLLKIFEFVRFQQSLDGRTSVSIGGEDFPVLEENLRKIKETHTAFLEQSLSEIKDFVDKIRKDPGSFRYNNTPVQIMLKSATLQFTQIPAIAKLISHMRELNQLQYYLYLAAALQPISEPEEVFEIEEDETPGGPEGVDFEIGELPTGNPNKPVSAGPYKGPLSLQELQTPIVMAAFTSWEEFGPLLFRLWQTYGLTVQLGKNIPPQEQISFDFLQAVLRKAKRAKREFVVNTVREAVLKNKVVTRAELRGQGNVQSAQSPSSEQSTSSPLQKTV